MISFFSKNAPDLQNNDDKDNGKIPSKTQNENDDKENGNFSLMQIGVVFLAVVSFFTTANGMKTYIFIDDSVIAYAASAAIQSILLALSMNLPGYLRGIQRQKNLHWIAKTVLYLTTLLLTGVILFCSSWFSYVYIADIIHQDSWGTDSELLVQQTYRTELYAARDYAHTYRIYLEESLGEKIFLLEIQASELPDNETNSILDWEEEREKYVENGGTTTASYMSTVIDAMNNALREDAAQEARDLAVRVIADAKENISARMEAIQQNLDTLNANISSYNNQIAGLTTRINNATEDTDVQNLSEAINYYTGLIRDLAVQQVNLQTESLQLDDALFRLSTYESVLGLNNSTSAISIRTSLVQLQSEFSKQEPDAETMLDIVESIFDSLRNAAHSISGDGEQTADYLLTYTNLLVQMNQLLRNLTDYIEVKDIEADLNKLIASLRSTNTTTEPETDNAPSESDDASLDSDGAASGAGDTNSESDITSMEPDNGALEFENTPTDSDDTTPELDDTTMESDEETLVNADTPLQSETFSSESDNMLSGSVIVEDEEDSWKKGWGENLEKLKGEISALPTYSESEETGDNAVGALSESQLDILRNYDRNEASKELDDMIRRYIARHNAIYEGIIYIQSPYRSLAVFALVLAFSFDLSGFVFGIVIQGRSPKQKEGSCFSINPSTPSANGNRRTDWSILESLNQYVVLTGDYESRDETYYYKVFRNGVLEQWLVQDKVPYQKGIYIQDATDPAKGKLVDGFTQELRFIGQADETADGIYVDCQLLFDEGGLILVQNDERRNFIASINEYVPVHSYNPHKGENQTIPAKQLGKAEIRVQTAVVALNAKGTRVSAIYIIEQ